jgi:hypothetical protein
MRDNGAVSPSVGKGKNNPCEYAVQAGQLGEGASVVRCCLAKPSPALEAAARFLQGFKTLRPTTNS